MSEFLMKIAIGRLFLKTMIESIDEVKTGMCTLWMPIG